MRSRSSCGRFGHAAARILNRGCGSELSVPRSEVPRPATKAAPLSGSDRGDADGGQQREGVAVRL